MEVYVEAIGLVAPGLEGWQSAQEVLNGKKPWQIQPLDKYKPHSLPANERRRATDLVRTSFRVLEDLESQHPDLDLSQYASVFASSGGDYPIIDRICQTLREKDRLISPTVFHNSVHNSASGYWSIAKGAKKPSTSLSAYDCSFGAGLLEAIGFCLIDDYPTLFTCYDIKPPEPLFFKRDIPLPFATALTLQKTQSENSVAKLDVNRTEITEITNCIGDLKTLQFSNPAARGLPLMVALSKKQPTNVVIQAAEHQFLAIGVTPC